ncbi:MAG TPA: TonB-dependent receptor, partial [Rhodothermales bacterium]|nr:TonB-dependent receptor [Rhodothermales bacterium]
MTARAPLAALVFLLLLAPGVRAQSASIRGFVRDLDGQPLPGVNVTLTAFPTPDADRLLGGATDANGFYAVTGFPAGRYLLRATFVGYTPFVDTLNIAAGVQQIDVALTEGELGLDEVAVVGERAGGAADVTAGFQRVRPEDVLMVPSPDVAGDLANYLTTLPGIVTSGDRGGQLFVRGGEPTQNLVLLDGMPVFLPFHVLGFYSAFPADLLQAADVYAGGYGARFGGQLSSVLDVTTRPGNLRRFGARASVAPFIVGGTVEGPIVPGQASILLSGRRSLVEEVGSALAGRDLPYQFSDAFGKLYFSPVPSSQLTLTGMYTTDRGAVGDPDSERPDEVSWTNAVGGFRYLFLPPSIPTRAELRLNYSQTESTLGPSGGAVVSPDSANATRTSSISRYNVEFDLSYFLAGGETKLGGFLRRTSLFNELGGLFQNVLTTDDDVLEAGLYLEPEFKLGPLTVGAGARFTLSPSLGQQFFEPRFRAVFQTRRH